MFYIIILPKLGRIIVKRPRTIIWMGRYRRNKLLLLLPILQAPADGDTHNCEDIIILMGGRQVCFNFQKAIGRHRSVGLYELWTKFGVCCKHHRWHMKLCGASNGKLLKHGYLDMVIKMKLMLQTCPKYAQIVLGENFRGPQLLH